MWIKVSSRGLCPINGHLLMLYAYTAYCKASADYFDDVLMTFRSHTTFNWVSLRIVMINDLHLCVPLSQIRRAGLLSMRITFALTLENLSSGFAAW